jgi:Uma2 family endonuclease
MATVPNTRTVTYEEWLRMPESREEVVNGEIRPMPSPTWSHCDIADAIRDAILPQIDRGAVRVTTSQFDLVIRLNPLTVRAPDLAAFERSTIIERDGRIHSVPRLVVEVLSPSNTRREREEKLGDYAFLSVPEVWVVSPEALTVEVLYLEEGRLRQVQLLSQGILTPRHFPNIHIDIAAIWPEWRRRR